MATQQGGLGIILTMLIITVPPMAAVFFQGVMGSFTPYSAFGQQGGQGVIPSGQPGAGTPVYSPPPQPGGGTSRTPDLSPTNSRIAGGQHSTEASTGQRGLANREERSP